MFLASSAKPIDPQLYLWVDEIEAQSPGLSVLAARQFRYSIYQAPVEVTVSEPRKFNVLEEFVLRAGIELNPPPTEDELAAVLGLDSVFVQNTAANLRALQTLEIASTITVTPQGRQFYQQGCLLQSSVKVQIYAITDPLVGHLAFQSNSLNEILIDQPDLANFVTIQNKAFDISSLALTELQKLIQDSGLGLHVPASGKIVTDCCVTASPKVIWKTMSLFVIFDALEDELRLQVRHGQQILESASNWLEVLKAQGKVCLNTLCNLSDEVIAKERLATLNQQNKLVEVRLEKIRQQALLNAKVQRQEPQVDSSEAGTAVQLRDGEIHQAFLDALNSAQDQILIYSPWVSKSVVDNKFLQILQNLANRGVRILIGHGISRRQEDEERPVPSEVEEQLLAIKTNVGLSAVHIFWLGASHAKEIIVDRKVHLCGSHNWLSYRGDYLPRGETVYRVTIPHQVQSAYEFLSGRFQAHAQKLWDAALLERNATQAAVPMCIWGALGMEEIALNQLQQNNFLELFPVWLQVVYYRLQSGLSPEMLNILGAALQLMSEVSEQEPNLECLRQGWCQIMGTVAKLDADAALKLLSGEAWSQFIRLGIGQLPPDSPDKFIFRYAS